MFNALLISYTIAMILAFACVFMIALQRTSREQFLAVLITIFIAILTVGYWFSLLADNETSAIMAQKLIYIGGCQIYYILLQFFAQYCKIKIPTWIKAALMSINSIIMLTVMFLEYNPFMYKSVEFKIIDGIPNLVKEYGFIHTLYIVMMVIYMLSVIGIAIRQVIRKSSIKMMFGTTGIFMVALVPTAAYAIEKVADLAFDIVPFSLVIAEIIILFLVYQIKIYDINDTAREYMFDVMEDALIVVDKNCKFKGANNAAKQLFPNLREAALDDEMSSVDMELAGIIEHDRKEDINYRNRIYMPMIKPIIRKDNIKGYVARFFDVTTEREKTELLENYNEKLEEEVDIKTAKLQDVQKQVVLGFANIVENRDNITGSHVRRTSTYVSALVNEMYKRKLYHEILTVSYIAQVKLAAPLHDIGKIAISDVILNKQERYTDEEYEIMKKHTVVGAEIIEKNLLSIEDFEYYKVARDLALYHHEKWNGKGYPEKLSGEEIPLCARIMSIVDVFDALVSERPYKPAFSVDRAFDIIQAESGESFDPIIADTFIAIKSEIKRLVESNGREDDIDVMVD